MAQAPAAAPARPRPPARPRWQVPLLVGFCFGLGYGITHRLLALQLPALVRLGQGFEVRPFPGTSLESLQLRFGADTQDIRGVLDRLEPDPKPAADQPLATPEPDSELERDVGSPDPRVDAPAPPQLPSADLPQFSPEAGPP